MKTLFVVLKSVLVIFLLMLCVSSTSAQKKMHVITLKNGNVLQGKVIRQVPGDFLEIETQDKNFWKFDMEDIAEIRFEKRKLPKNYRDTIVQPLKGMSYEIKMGVLAGVKGNEDDAPFSMLVSGIYRFKSGISAGGGVGYETLNGGSMPVFGEIKYQAKLNGISPFIYLQSGYSIALENQFGRNFYHNSEDDVNSVGGILINPGIGFNLGNIGDNRFTLNIGYRFQKMKHKWEKSYTKDTEYLKEEYNRLSIHLGLIF